MTIEPTEMVEEPHSVPGTLEQPGSQHRLNWESLAAGLLILVLLLGARFRFTGLDWDDNHHLHPDERFLTIVATQLQPASDPIQYLQTSKSPLNPYNAGQGFYVYGNFPMTVTRYAAEWASRACELVAGSNSLPPSVCTQNFTAYDGVHLLGRFLSGLVDLVSVAFLFLIGRRLYDWRVGLLAALLQASAVMPIQQSHFFTMDNWAAALTTLALYAAVRAAGLAESRPRWRARWWILFGLGLGLAVASRINVAPLALMANVAAVVWLARRGHTWHSIRTPSGNLDLQRAILGVLLAAAVSAVSFRLAQPYAFADGDMVRQAAIAETGQEPGTLGAALRAFVALNPQWRANMEEIQRLQTPDASFPPALQWTDRTPLLFPFTNILLYGMGITAGAAAFIGLIWALWQLTLFRPGWTAHAIPAVWSSIYFLFMGTRWVKSIRYFLPIYPTLLLLAAWLLFECWDRAGKGASSRRLTQRLGAAALMIGVVAPTILWANAFIRIYQEPVTRIAASDWIFEHVPTGATLLYEVETEQGWQEQTLQLPLHEYSFFPGVPPLTLHFVIPEDGTVTAVRLNYVSSLDEQPGSQTMRVNLDTNPAAAEVSFNVDEQRRPLLIDIPDTLLRAESAHSLTLEAGPESALRLGTSRLANEHWDDLLPVGTDGRNAYGSYYVEVSGGQRPVTHPDSPEKRQEVIQWLDEADYIMLSSQRAMWSLPRLPLTYPMMMRYYEALFSGELGFDLAAQFHADLHIGPLYISDTTGRLRWGSPPEVGWSPPWDLAAEEAFSVYDHPPVWIFAKSDRYRHENTAQVLGSVDLSQATFMTPGEATQAPNGLMLSETELAIQRQNGTFRAIFDVDGVLSRHPGLAAAVWWLAAVLLGWLAFPITFIVLRGLPDKGYALARVLALLFLSYFAWLAASLHWLPHTRSSIVFGLLLMTLFSLVIFLTRRAEITDFIRGNLAYIGLAELIGLALYLLLIAVRLGNPDVWDVIWGGEKPMDLSYFTAVLKSTVFPPYDPWFAGGYINYYYYGFVYAGILTKLLGILPALAYNLILPMLFSFAGLGVFSIAYNLVAANDGPGTAAGEPALRTLNRRAVAAGIAAAALAVMLGNLAEVGVLLNAWYRAGSEAIDTGIAALNTLVRTLDGGIQVLGGQPAPIYTGDWFWTASRAINANPGEVQPITEFPFFTFLYGDLHAHMISLPLTILALGWAVSLALQADWGKQEAGAARWWETGLQWVMGGIAIGVLRATNTWDWPTYLVVGGLAVTYYVWRRHGRLSFAALGHTGMLLATLVSLSVITFWPYAANYGVGYTAFSLWPGSYTHVTNYLSVYGLFLFLVITHLAREFRAWTGAWTQEGMRQMEPIAGPLMLTLAVYVLLLLVLFLKGYLIAPLALTLVIISGLLGLRPQLPTARRIVLILISAALALTLFVEVFVLDGDIGRMNTVFKFYLQVWVMLSVVGGAAVAWAWPAVIRRPRLRKAWQGTLAVLLIAAGLYPVLATKAKWDIRMSKEAPHTLDGMAFMEYVQYGDTDYAGNSVTVPLHYDYDAIQWMYRHIEGSPVIAEANDGTAYRSIGNRIAMYTGLPTIIGWDWHQRQQRAVLPGSLVSARVQDVNRLYATPVPTEALAILNRYDVAYIYIGKLEQTQYPPEGLAKFERMAAAGYLEEVYRNEGTRIYKIMGQNAP